MNVLVCVKRVPATGGQVSLTPDGRDIDTRYLGFVVGPHEECALEEALRIVEAQGGSTAVLTLGPAAAEAQLRDAMAMGIERGLLLETDGREWDPAATAGAIVDAVRAGGVTYDLILFGNESADAGNYQIGVRVAHALDRPCLTGIKQLEIRDGQVIAKREAGGGAWDVLQARLPAVVTVKEGINLPRYPSLPGRLKAKKKPVERLRPAFPGNAVDKLRLKLPEAAEQQVDVLGRGPAAAPKVVEILRRLGLV